MALLFVGASLLAGQPGVGRRVESAPRSANPNAASPGIFGTTTQAYRPEDLAHDAQYVGSRGIHDSRIIFSWEHIQTNSANKDFFDFSVYDAYMQAMPATTQLGIVGNNIDWTPQPCGCTARNNSIDGMLNATRPPLGGGAGTLWSDWDIFVYTMVSRYGPHANGLGAGYGQNRVHTWEVMNEVDSGVYYPSSTDALITAHGQKYGAILKRSIQIITLADPAAAIIPCGISDYYPNESAPNQTNLLHRTQTWISAVASTGAYDTVAGFSIHPYWGFSFDGGSSLKQYLDNLSAELVAWTGRPIPLWVTEIGYLSNSLGLGCGPVCQTTVETESRVMIQNLTQVVARTGIAALYWFLSNTLTPQGGGWDPDSYALAKECDSNTAEFIEAPRGQAFYAFKHTVVDPGYRFVSSQIAGETSYYTFSNGTSYLHVLWTKSTAYVGFAGMNATTYAGLHTTDDLANTIDTGSTPASARLTLTQEPVYLISPTQIPLASLSFAQGPPLAQQSVGVVSANCTKITGWACNSGDFTRPLTIGLYDGDLPDGKPIAYTDANQQTGNAVQDQMVADTCGGYSGRSFSLSTPLWVKGSGRHTISAYALNLDGSPASKLSAGPSDTTFQCVNVAPTTRPGTPVPVGPTPPAPNPTARPGQPTAPSPPLPVPPHR